MNLVRTILIMAAVYFAFRLIGKYLMPWLARKAGQKMKQKFEEEMRRRTGHQQQPQRREGEITIQYTDKNKKKSTSSASSSRVGEYIDYEEVD